MKKAIIISFAIFLFAVPMTLQANPSNDITNLDTPDPISAMKATLDSEPASSGILSGNSETINPLGEMGDKPIKEIAESSESMIEGAKNPEEKEEMQEKN